MRDTLQKLFTISMHNQNTIFANPICLYIRPFPLLHDLVPQPSMAVLAFFCNRFFYE